MADKHELYERCQLVTESLGAQTYSFDRYKARFTDAKDNQRLNKIYNKYPQEKWIQHTTNMANKITTTEKAIRRAMACIEEMPYENELTEQMVRIFLKRAIALHAHELPPDVVVKLRVRKAI